MKMLYSSSLSSILRNWMTLTRTSSLTKCHRKTWRLTIRSLPKLWLKWHCPNLSLLRARVTWKYASWVLLTQANLPFWIHWPCETYPRWATSTIPLTMPSPVSILTTTVRPNCNLLTRPELPKPTIHSSQSCWFQKHGTRLKKLTW